MSKYNYPEPQKKEIGCKVSWYTYSSLEDAEKASKIAKEDAIESAEMGFDFGYLTPSTITKNDDGTFTVVIT